MYLSILFKVVGGLGIFLFGMGNMSSGMQKIAGKNFKKILSTLTSNRFLGIAMGVVITAIIQSSSVSTVMTIGFVNASLLTLKQGLGVILGANIGTTITGWLLALKIGKYGLTIAGFSGLMYVFSKKESTKIKWLTAMGFGFIFLGLEIMSGGLSPLRNEPSFIKLFHAFSADSYFGMLKAVLVGAMITAIVQSSSATLGITITLALQGLIDFPTAVALVLGENVGTTITALIASIGSTSNAKRAAIAHTLINIIGIIWATSIFNYYIIFLDRIVNPSENLAVAIATAHTIFNVANVIIITPFISYLDIFLRKVIKDKEESKTSVTKLNKLMMKLPETVVYQTKAEVNTMAYNIKRVFNLLSDCTEDMKTIEVNIQEISEVEEKLDLFEKEIYDLNFELMNRQLAEDMVETTRANLLVCDEYETISDYLGRIGNRFLMFVENDITIDEDRLDFIKKLHGDVKELFKEVHSAYNDENKSILSESLKKHTQIKSLFKTARRYHFVNTNETLPQRLNTGYLDIINFYRRISDHLYNIIEYYMKL